MRVPSYNDHDINARRNKKSATNRQPDRHEVVHPCLRYDLLPMSPVRTSVRPGELVGLEPCSITLWWLVRVRRAPLPSRAQLENFLLMWKCSPRQIRPLAG